MVTIDINSEHLRLSDAEELGNALTHGAACVLATVATGWVLATYEFSSPYRWYGFLAYGASVAFVFLCSMISHVVRSPDLLRRTRAWDQGAIYLMIAGSYTPSIIAFADTWTTSALLAGMWGMAAFGFCMKVFVEHRVNAVTTITYLLLGWVPALVLGPGVPLHFFLWMLGGGVFYSLGVYFLMNDREVKYYHVAWHLCVVIAASVHFYAICTLAIL